MNGMWKGIKDRRWQIPYIVTKTKTKNSKYKRTLKANTLINDINGRLADNKSQN